MNIRECARAFMKVHEKFKNVHERSQTFRRVCNTNNFTDNEISNQT